MENLWPEDITVVETKAPVTILKEQASLISRQTKGIVEGEVTQIPDPLGDQPFGYGFHLKAPALGDYRYLLLSIVHDVTMYPILIRPDESTLAELRGRKTLKEFSVDPRGIVAQNEGEFLKILSLVFSSSRTKRVVRAILAQSGSGPVAA